MKMTTYKHRLVARIVLEATSPLAVGSGQKDIITDSPVARDCNGLPYIPGTSLMGLIRPCLKNAEKFLGYQDGEQGEGSKVIISDALLVGADSKAIDGLQDIANDEYLRHFEVLPVRQHVRITEKGVAAKYGKFDEEVVYTGTRFVFEIEQLSEDGDEQDMQKMLDQIAAPTFRIGSGTRCGFGSMKVVSIQYNSYNLTKEADLKAYLSKTSCLSDNFDNAQKIKTEENLWQGWTKYTLELSPLDFFLFSSGFGDEDADMTPVKEQRISWEDGKPAFKEACILIPATSVKGAIAHRTAYIWNKITERSVEEGTAISCEKNPAVIALFGTTTDEDEITPTCGNVIFSDVLLEEDHSIVLPHIKIDKFTGGVMDGALFQEKVTFAQGQMFREVIYVKDDGFKERGIFNDNIKRAFEDSLHDLCIGTLPLGGGTNRGNGIFEGTIQTEGTYSYDKASKI